MRLGILGGVGAAAGLRLASLVVQRAQTAGAKRDCDFPDFMLYNLPAKGLSALGVEDRSQAYQEVLRALQVLERAGCSVGVIGCNTLHCFFDELQTNLETLYLVNMVEQACSWVAGKKVVGVLCSQTTKQLGLYEAALAKYDVKAIATTNVEQQCVDEAIAAAIAGKVTPAHRNTLKNIGDMLVGRGAQSIILGCTELPLVLTDFGRVHLVDAGAKAIDRAIQMVAVA